MAEELIKQFLDAAGAKEIVDQLKALIDAKASAGDIASALASYSDTEAVQGLIKAAIEASEKKIFGDGELAEAFDTIKEIGDYLKDHDDVATGIYEALGKKADKTDVESLQGKVSTIESQIGLSDGEGNSLTDRIEKVETDLGTAQGDITKAQGDITKAQGDITKAQGDIDEIKGELEGYVKAENIQAVALSTIQGWFA